MIDVREGDPMDSIRNWRLGGAIVAIGALALIAVAAVGVLTADAGKKKSDKGYLGVYMQELDSDVREGLDLNVSEGVLISGIMDDSPAAEAGLEDGDVIVMFDGKKVTSADDLRDFVSDTEPGTEVKINLIRDGSEATLSLTIGERPDDFFISIGNDHSWSSGDHSWSSGKHNIHISDFLGGPKLGVSATDLNEGLAEYFDTKPESGVLVLEVHDDTVAEGAGVKAGDVIQKIGDDAVTSVDEMRESLGEFEEGDEFDVTVLRKGKTQTLKATMDDAGTFYSWNGKVPQIRIDRKHFRAPRVHVDRYDEDMREELDEMRKELDELKKELKEKS